MQKKTHQDQMKNISYEELKNHSTYLDAWISINGIVYDITSFLNNHPFGDTFRGNLGTECGGMFSSAHMNTNVEEKLGSEEFLINNAIVVIGRLDISKDHLHKNSDSPLLDRIVYKETHNDEFWLELKTKVASYLRDNNETTHYSFREGLFYIIYYLSIYLLLSYFTWVEGSFLASIILGVHMVCALANISHMAAHYGFTRFPLLNSIALNFFDLAGMSGLEWQITHQTHHNQPHSSIDHQTNVYDYIGVRRHKYMKYKFYHKFQHLYYWFIVSPYHFFKIIGIPFWLTMNKEFIRRKREMLIHVFAIAVLLSQVIYCAYLHGFWIASALFIVFSLAFSQAAFILLFNDYEDTHNVLGINEDINNFHNEENWAEIQVRTSNNWYPTNWFLSFIEFHHGYFNYHIEHHLFPTFKPTLLKKISPLVKSICEKHKVPYISTSFFDVQTSLHKHITKMGFSFIREKV